MRASLLILAAAAGPALADGPRFPATSTINFQRAHPDHIVAGTTFGTVETSDNGATWHWMCDTAIGYGGIFDPVYVDTETGGVFATTFEGLRVRRDGCTFELQPATGSTFISTASEDADGNLFYAAADNTDNKIYKSFDNGVTWPQSATPPGSVLDEWWQSVIAAPSNTQIVYLSGYLVSGGNKTFQLFASADGGQTFAPMGVNIATSLTTAPQATIDIVAIDPTDPSTFYLLISNEDGHQQFGVWKTTDGGDSFTEIRTEQAGETPSLNPPVSFALRTDGDLVVSTQLSGSHVSHDGGATWVALTGAPHINCLRESALGELWACTANDSLGADLAPDPGGIMKTTDLVTWTPVLRFQDIQDPVACPSGTPQADVCVAADWCNLRDQLGITSNVISCNVAGDATIPGDGAPVTQTPAGCCDSGGAAPSTLALAPVVAMVLRRRRRRCSGASIDSRTTRNTSRS